MDRTDPRDQITRNQRARFTFGRLFDDGPQDNRPGELLTMGDGSQWFHAYSGKAPVEITDANRSGLTISA
jgi:hypothetical protein